MTDPNRSDGYRIAKSELKPREAVATNRPALRRTVFRSRFI